MIREINKEEYFSQTKDISTSVFQTKEWFTYLEKYNKKSIPIFLEIIEDNNYIYLSGMIIKKCGIKIFGSPFEQWGTSSLGFCSKTKIVNLKQMIVGIKKYLFRKYGVLYLEILDENISELQAKNERLHYEKVPFLYKKIDADSNEIISSFKRSTKKRIRNYQKAGYDVREVKPSKELSALYYNQLIDVFALQNKKPFYGKDRVDILFDIFKNSNYIYCLESYRINDNKVLGTAISFGYNNNCVTWGSASSTEGKASNMNHVLRWKTIEHWKNQGCIKYDFGGYAEYKLDFKPDIVFVPRIYESVIPFLHFAKIVAKKAVAIIRNHKK